MNSMISSPLADFISLHTPLTNRDPTLAERRSPEENKTRGAHHQLRPRRLDRRKRAAQSLGNGHVAGAALDVFETEPLPPDSSLRKVAEP